MIKEKKILINGSIAEIGMKVNIESDIIHINGKQLNNKKLISEVILLNKPKNVLLVVLILITEKL